MLGGQTVLGVLTLENVIERILQMDISDEKDVDMVRAALEKLVS